MIRPNYLRPAPIPKAYHYRPSLRKRVLGLILNLVALLVILAVVGIAFILSTIPALPVIVPLLEKPKQVAPAPVERGSTLGKHL